MTLQECKEKVAMSYGHGTWETLVGCESVRTTDNCLCEAAELYATSQYNQALEDLKSKVQDIQSNSSDNDDEWFALQSVIEQIEILKLKK